MRSWRNIQRDIGKKNVILRDKRMKELIDISKKAEDFTYIEEYINSYPNEIAKHEISLINMWLNKN